MKSKAVAVAVAAAVVHFRFSTDVYHFGWFCCFYGLI